MNRPQLSPAELARRTWEYEHPGVPWPGPNRQALNAQPKEKA